MTWALRWALSFDNNKKRHRKKVYTHFEFVRINAELCIIIYWEEWIYLECCRLELSNKQSEIKHSHTGKILCMDIFCVINNFQRRFCCCVYVMCTLFTLSTLSKSHYSPCLLLFPCIQSFALIPVTLCQHRKCSIICTSFWFFEKKEEKKMLYYA